MRTVDPERWPNMKGLLETKARVLRRRRPAIGVESRVRSSFSDALQEFWDNCSIRGLKYISNRSFPNFVRYGYTLLFTLALCVAVTRLCYNVYDLNTTTRAQVDVRSITHAIQSIPFPAVALCSSNVITKEPLMNYTMFLDSLDQNHTHNWRSIRENLLQFGSLLTLNLPNLDLAFTQFLSHAEPEGNVSRLMYELSSSCAKMLKQCSWRGRVVPCERLFATRVTPLGYCCVFNSRYYFEDIHRPPKYLDMTSVNSGLAVVVQENPDDFAFIRRASIGLDVLLFDGNEYPILEGGGVRMYPVERNASVYMAVSVRSQYPSKAISDDCPNRSVEGPLESRSYAWCLTQCRWRTLAALCSCRSYTFPPDPADKNPTCSLSHLTCLNKHREKLIYYYPSGHTEEALNEELENGQVCTECVPDCTRYVYSASVAVVESSNSVKNVFNLFANNESLVNSTVIRLFFSSEHQTLYVIEAHGNWYQTFATMSSEWSSIVGVTLVSAAEVGYFFTVRWLHHYRRRTGAALTKRDGEQ